jgi:hypothetical protein
VRTLRPMDHYLLQGIANRAGITVEQATAAVASVVRILSARLPSPVVGQIRAVLDGEDGGEVREVNGSADIRVVPGPRP